ncbi:hypothetical protein GFY24_24150 [Nocardia sp. SYP-A9097]|uniref:hypothetical protein n=1 Tax=Nocardia sp. SYP-A9097 TaxID=2663237 RepID=UPI00129B521B|nr:hypothetical protein [Nocardia sp. SYP-A9097]MRH90499.1 hypothetical protein [Nocardia sp. SYP-A9097]
MSYSKLLAIAARLHPQIWEVIAPYGPALLTASENEDGARAALGVVFAEAADKLAGTAVRLEENQAAQRNGGPTHRYSDFPESDVCVSISRWLVEPICGRSSTWPTSSKCSTSVRSGRDDSAHGT